MSNQYPGGFTNPHRGGFGNQLVNMNNMGVPNQMGMMGYNQGGMMQQGQQGMQGNMGVMGDGSMQQHPNAGMQSPSHMSQQQQQQAAQQVMNQQQQQSVQVQQQQQQMVQQQQQQQQQRVQQPQQPQLTLQTPTTPNSGITNSNQMMVGVHQGVHIPHQAGIILNQQQQVQQKEFNSVSLCRFGQETVQDIVSRYQEVLQVLRAIQPPNGANSASTAKKVQEQFRTIRLLFKRLRILYDKCNDNCQQGMEYTHVESLIPLKDEPDHKPEPVQSEEYKKVLQENRELVENVMLKNKQLREVIDRIRIIVWEINTMLSMRRS